MPKTKDFIATVYDKLASIFNNQNTSKNIFLQMAWPAISLSDADFKDANGEYDKNIAEETVSALANVEPTFNKVKFENSGFEIDDLYEIIIASARPFGVPSEQIQSNPLYSLFSDAQFEFQNQKRGSITDPHQMYQVVKTTPSDWYKDTSASYWTQVNIKSAEIKPVTRNSPFIKRGGEQLINRGVWTVKPKTDTVTAVAELLKGKIKLETQQLEIKRPLDSAAISRPQILSDLTRQAVIAANIPQGDTLGLQSSVVREQLETIKKPYLNTKIVPTNIFEKNKELLKKVTASHYDLDNFQIKRKKLKFSETAFLNDILIKGFPTRPASPNTNGFNISFKYCQVHLDREWLKLALLANPSWYMYGTAINEYSNGSNQNNPGMFPLLPLSFIVIRDLKITANWSTEDKRNIADAVAFGPFDIRNKTFNQGSIISKGMQIIGYTSRVMPQLPPKEGIEL